MPSRAAQARRCGAAVRPPARHQALQRDTIDAVTPLVAKYGGKYLARTADFRHIEGDSKDPALCVLLEWPSKEAFDGSTTTPTTSPT